MEQAADLAQDKARKRKITFYSGEEAGGLWATGTLHPQKGSPEAEAAAERLKAVGWPDAGAMTKVLVSQTQDEGGFQLHYIWFKPNWVLRKHYHLADCLYYVISGEARMGRRILKPGDSFFVPSGVRYQYGAGPEGCEVLEIRRGSQTIDTVVADQSEAQWDRMIQIMATNRPAWEQMEFGPTFARLATKS